MAITIRDWRMNDIDRVCELEEEAFSMPWHKESFIDMVNNPDALYLVAVETVDGDKQEIVLVSYFSPTGNIRDV